jgi:uncharacterized FlaG/YvyC family protein
MAELDLSGLLGIETPQARSKRMLQEGTALQQAVLAGSPAAVAAANLPTAAASMRGNVGRLFGIDTRTPAEKLQAELAGTDLSTSAGLSKAAEFARKMNMNAQAIALATQAGLTRQQERETQTKKNTIVGLRAAVSNLMGDDETSKAAISQITDTDVLTELYKELNDPAQKGSKRSTQTITRDGQDVIVLIDEETGEEVRQIGTAPSKYAATVQSVQDGRPVTLVLNSRGEVTNTIAGVTEGKTASDIYYDAFVEERKNNPDLTPLDFQRQWEQAGNSNPERANYEYAMQDLEEGDAGWMPFGDWLNRGLLTTDQRNYQQAKAEGYDKNFMTWLSENDEPTLVKEFKAAQEFGWEGTIDQWVELGGSKNINLPSVPTGYQVKTDIDDNGNTVYRAEKIGGVGMTALEAGRLALVETGIEAANYFSDFVFNDDGSVNKTNVLAFFGTDKLNVPGPGRSMEALFLEAIEAKLRLETGAAAPDSEVERLKTRLMPGVFDSDETIKFKQLMLHRFLNQAYGYIKGTEEGGFTESGEWTVPGTTPERAAIRSRNIINKLISEIDRYESSGQKPAELMGIDELRQNLLPEGG